MPANPLQFSLNPSSAAEAGGDSLTEVPFNVVFGNKVAARDANGGGDGGGSTIFTGLIKDVAVGLVVAIAARFVWKQVK